MIVMVPWQAEVAKGIGSSLSASTECQDVQMLRILNFLGACCIEKSYSASTHETMDPTKMNKFKMLIFALANARSLDRVGQERSARRSRAARDVYSARCTAQCGAQVRASVQPHARR